jgi:hypothetical protein
MLRITLYQLTTTSAYEIVTLFINYRSVFKYANEQVSFRKTFYDVRPAPVRLAVCLQAQPHRHWDRHHRRPQDQ